MRGRHGESKRHSGRDVRTFLGAFFLALSLFTLEILPRGSHYAPCRNALCNILFAAPDFPSLWHLNAPDRVGGDRVSLLYGEREIRAGCWIEDE